ncbi:TPM domain-containing protein [Leptospira sp. 201903070]|uniref:TPM domain-containing protein n=1 Tax=Leptospira ainlahdjerensis TaxID=2810033 RepID=A0ABS2U9P1_9LEPT|nr:TPM domain-containing protein [Leptospira ainlahdjerensis]MBM9577081.1 TPM domain-containing protein [Leptospira ainlahdjerensis]
MNRNLFFFISFLLLTAGWNVRTENSFWILQNEEWRAEDPEIPTLRTQITDMTSTLTDSQKSVLTGRLVQFEKRKGSQIAVLVIGSTKDWSIEEYAVKAFEKWKLGRKGVSDGALVVVAIQDHKTRIEVGYGLEGAIPDAIAKRIISDFMIPQFKNGNYYQGISDAIDQLIAVVNGEELPEGTGRVAGSDSETGGEDLPELPNKLITAFILLVVLGKIFGFLFGNGLSGGISGIIFIVLGLFWSITLWMLIPGALLLWFFVLANGGGMGGSGSSWGSSSSGGGGSWSGGGGSSGGGGASGSW